MKLSPILQMKQDNLMEKILVAGELKMDNGEQVPDH